MATSTEIATSAEITQYEFGANNRSVGAVSDICMPVEKAYFFVSVLDVAISVDVTISSRVAISFADVAILIDVAISVDVAISADVAVSVDVTISADVTIFS